MTLNNGVQIPQVGLGVWKASNSEAEQAVSWALETGYRLVDTAALYGNEEGVGKAVRSSGVPRQDIFVTTKLWNADQGYDNALRAFDTSIGKLGLDYVDLYLIHWPMPAHPQYKETWKAFVRLYEEKRVRAIGVSNFQPDHLQDLLSSTDIVPAVNQIELHPYLQQHETREICTQHDIQVESWSPIGGSHGNVLADPVIGKLAGKYGKSPAQIVLRWHVQSGLVVIPKSTHKERIIENISLFDFELTDEDMSALAALDKGTRFGPDPAVANFT
jgi:diketogulonate reductase-like aldo/keto reductase